MSRMKLNTSQFSDFARYGLPLLLASHGRDAICDAPLRKLGQWRASFNRLQRAPGHVPENLEVVGHFTNHSGNARAKENDVLNPARMLKIASISNRVELSRVQKIALRVL